MFPASAAAPGQRDGVSGNGRFVAFSSASDNVVAGDSNGLTDTFLRDRSTGSVQRVGLHTVGEPRISGNGRYVSYVAFGGVYAVFDRVAGTTVTWNTVVAQNTPVVPDDGSVAIFGRPGSFGVFTTACRVRDLSTGAEATCPDGGPGFGTVALDAVSRNGRFVLYFWLDQDGGGTSARLVWDRQSGTVTPAPAGLIVFGNSVVISDNGRYLAATDFTPGSPFAPQLFDRQTGTLRTLPGAAPDGSTLPVDISANGGTVALYSEATNLAPDDANGGSDIYLWDTVADTVTLASRNLDTGAALPTGATSCSQGSGNLLASGAGACVRTNDPLTAEDQNDVTDAWLVPR